MKLLADAGLANGLELKLTTLNQSQFVTAAQVIQANLAEAGITLNLDVLDGGSFWSVAKKGAEQAAEDLGVTLKYSESNNDPEEQAQLQAKATPAPAPSAPAPTPAKS